MLNSLNKVKKLIQITLILLTISGITLGGWKYVQLSNRLARIENKLGGQAKINCNDKDTINKVRQSVVRIVGGEGEGSGFAVKPNVIMTNFHVIEYEPSPKIIFPDNSFETGEVMMADKSSDLAIIKIKKELPEITWGKPDELEPADELLAIGFPLGGTLVGEASVNKGSLAGRRKDKTNGVEYLQTDITLTGGVSGGPMVNVCGEVEGINTSGQSGIGFGISTNTIKDKWAYMAFSPSSEWRKDLVKLEIKPDESPLEAVRAFYTYLKLRKMNIAFAMLSDNFKGGYTFEQWQKGYAPLLDTSVLKIANDEKIENRVNVKLTTKDLVGDEITYKYFEGYWDVKKVNGDWVLWDPDIKEVENPSGWWFYE